MIKVFLLVSSMLIAGWVQAQPEVLFDINFLIPDMREDGTPLSPDDIGSYNLYQVDGDELTLIKAIVGPGAAAIDVSEAEGVVSVCVKTVDSFNSESSECSNTAAAPFKVYPPGPPNNLTSGQPLEINVNVSVNVNQKIGAQ